MPAFIFLGRKCRVASDDFFYPALLNILFQLPIVIFCIFYTVMFRSCSTMYFDWSGSPFWYIILNIPLLVLMIGTEGMIVHVSSKGTIVGSEHRLLLNPLVVTHLIGTSIEFTSVIIGTLLLSLSEICSDDFYFILAFVLAMGVDGMSSFLFLCCVLTSKKSSMNHPHSPSTTYGNVPNSERHSLLRSDSKHGTDRPDLHDDSIMYSPHQEIWERRCHNLCRCIQCFTCNLFGGHGTQSDSMSAVAEVVARFFVGEPDLVISDIVAGFVLLSAVQAHEYRHENIVQSPIDERFQPLTPSSSLLARSDTADNERISSPGAGFTEETKDSEIDLEEQDPMQRESEALERTIYDLAYYSGYSVGIYGWMLYVWSRPWTGVFRLLFSCCKTSHKYIIGDTAFHLHQTALQLETKLKENDIIFASFENNVYQPAFSITVDHKRRNVLITIRGTLSLEDCLTDAVAQSCSLDTVGVKWGFDGKDRFAHQGMLHSAEWLRDRIETLGLLPALFHNQRESLDSMFDEEFIPDCRDYGLKVIGHSLGAGAACLLTLMLRRDYPFVHCFAFSPPGCVISDNLAEEMEPLVTSCTVGKDIVGRSSMDSIQTLRNKVLYLIERTCLNKAEILGQLTAWKDPKELLYEDEEHVESIEGIKLREYRQMLEKLHEESPLVKMCMPGRIVHFKKPRTEKIPSGCWLICRPGGGLCCTSREDYYPRFQHRNVFENIRISRTMLDDHFPDKVHHVVQDLSKRLKTFRKSKKRRCLSS